MANLQLSFCSKDERFSLCVYNPNTRKRNYKSISDLTNPNFDYWDEKKQSFIEPSNEAIHNNNVLRSMKEAYQIIIDTLHPVNGKELFELYKTSLTVEAKKELTFGDFLIKLTHDLKYESGKVPSRNYQSYRTLRSALQKEGEIINLPLSVINDDHYQSFGEFIRTKHDGKNYKNLMKYFHAAINKARKQKLTTCLLEYKYLEDIPKSNAVFDKDIKGVEVLTKKQYEKFVKVDLSVIPHSGKNPDYYKEFYRDFCIFMYETNIRPVDIFRLQYNHIFNGEIRIHCKKKMNYTETKKALQEVEVTDTANAIINKYKGKSSKGYVFPFPMNEYDWDITNDPTSFNKWNVRKQGTMGKINKFLAKVKKKLGVDNLTLYTFRHTKFTHEIEANEKSLLKIAKEGGTSVKMLEDHYYHAIRKANNKTKKSNIR